MHRRAPPDTEAEDAHKKFVLNGRNGPAMALTFIVSAGLIPVACQCPAFLATLSDVLSGLASVLLWQVGALANAVGIGEEGWPTEAFRKQTHCKTRCGPAEQQARDVADAASNAGHQPLRYTVFFFAPTHHACACLAGGGAFYVPLFNILLGFSLKGSTALSQAVRASFGRSGSYRWSECATCKRALSGLLAGHHGWRRC